MSESVNSTLDIQWIAMAVFYLLLLIPIFLFQRWQLGLNRTLINSVLRMTLQLSVVGIYLHTLFGLQSVVINIVWLSIMALVASYTICKRAEVNLKRAIPFVNVQRSI
ncbi:ABC transporter permease [Photobacterium leiognathi]|uniref:ABC transporter permease n=1 Tax=Photobacterium leiognathi TaxID=553611 RepID=UPI003AF3B148